MRRANTTFVNLRAALDDVDPLVDASKPVAERARALPRRGARVRGGRRAHGRATCAQAVRRPGRRNDLIDFVKSVPPLADIAVETQARATASDARGRVPGRPSRRSRAARRIIAAGRPYTQDFLGWFDDFSTTGGGFDALGAYARGLISFAEFTGPIQPLLGTASPRGRSGPVKRDQFKRCPGAAEEAADDGSNVLSEAEERQILDCEESARATGNVPMRRLLSIVFVVLVCAGARRARRRERRQRQRPRPTRSCSTTPSA